MFKSLKWKRGGYIAEASIVYPVIVFITVLFIAVSVGMFIDVLNASEMENAVRRAANDESGTVIYNDSQDNTEHDVFDDKLPGHIVSGGIVQKSGTAVTRFSSNGGSEYNNNFFMFNIFSENKYVLYHSAVNEVSVLWQRQAEETLKNN
ncbi:MAG: hypothetical protein HFE90_01800 [Firmicutes bacterium]|nr:hypothetical protein [Bacillota bacterium]